MVSTQSSQLVYGLESLDQMNKRREREEEKKTLYRKPEKNTKGSHFYFDIIEMSNSL